MSLKPTSDIYGESFHLLIYLQFNKSQALFKLFSKYLYNEDEKCTKKEGGGTRFICACFSLRGEERTKMEGVERIMSEDSTSNDVLER